MRLYHCGRLKHPPSVNQCYRFTTRGYPHPYMTKTAKAWKAEAVSSISAQLDAQGFTPVEESWYTAVMRLDTMRLDADNQAKIVNDALKDALGIDDTHMGASVPAKRRVHRRADQGVDLWVAVTPAGEADFNARTNALVDEILALLAATKG